MTLICCDVYFVDVWMRSSIQLSCAIKSKQILTLNLKSDWLIKSVVTGSSYDLGEFTKIRIAHLCYCFACLVYSQTLARYVFVCKWDLCYMRLVYARVCMFKWCVCAYIYEHGHPEVIHHGKVSCPALPPGRSAIEVSAGRTLLLLQHQ